MEPVKQAMRDQAVYVGRAYFKHRAPIPTLTAVPETRHSNCTRTSAAAPFLCRSGRPKIARLLLLRFHVASSRMDENIIAATRPLFNVAVLRIGVSNL